MDLTLRRGHAPPLAAFSLMKSRMARVKSLFSAHKTHGMSCAARIALSLLTRMVSYGKDSSSFVPVFGADRIPADLRDRLVGFQQVADGMHASDLAAGVAR